MVMSVFEQITAITQSRTSDLHNTGKLHVRIKRMDVDDIVVVTVKLLSMIMMIKTKKDFLKTTFSCKTVL